MLVWGLHSLQSGRHAAMDRWTIITLLLSAECFMHRAQSASKYYDGPVRPYKFGYRIDGNQHRYEQKDENGIVMGEFGFITADGVYHITVYATDENGNFKILSMKNIRLMTTTPAPTVTPSTSPTKRTTQAPKRRIAKTRACSGCLITKDEVPDIGIRTTFDDEGITEKTTKPKLPNIDVRNSIGGEPAKINSKKPMRTKTGSKKAGPASPRPPAQQRVKTTKSETSLPSIAKDPFGLLYRFNYSLDFNEHAEQGDRRGAKNGTFFVNENDATQRNVTYTANENGFQPFIKWQGLDGGRRPSSNETNSLKGYEFVWFY